MDASKEQRDLRCGRRPRGLVHSGPPEQGGRVRFALGCPGDQITATDDYWGRGGVRLDTIAAREISPGFIIGGLG
jgi:hypothetical protein